MFLNDYSANVLPTVSLVPKQDEERCVPHQPSSCLVIRLTEEVGRTSLIANLHVALDDLTISHGLVGVVDFIQGEGLGEDLPRVDLTVQDGL